MAAPDQADDDTLMSDEELLNTVALSQLEELCQQCGVAADGGSKEELLQKLRAHAEELAAVEQLRRKERVSRVEQGTGTASRERYEIVGENDKIQYFTPSTDKQENEEEDEDDELFFFPLPVNKDDKKAINEEKKKEKTARPKPYRTQNDVLAGPIPDVEPDKNGERRVTVYNSADNNDLTGMAAAQPGQGIQAGLDPMIAGSSPQQGPPQPWDMDQQTTTKKATFKELEQAKETVTELVQTLLAMSGAPAFSHFDMPENLEDINSQEDDDNDEVDSGYSSANGQQSRVNEGATSRPFLGFDPTNVPGHILEESSAAVRANRGQVLQDVLREFELHAIGQDGMHGDNAEKGGGHFREVAKVRAFLEGFRRAQVRKTSRETVTMLLDKLVSEGIEGLDISLASMTRSSDDSDNINDLNDSLINYLDDVIRQQEKRVDLILASSDKDESPSIASQLSVKEEDPVEQLWNRTAGEDGEQIESIDPNDPKVQQVLREEADKSEAEDLSSSVEEKTAPEKILLLLTLLRERIKTEAAFANDERGRNLRTLAYCLRCPTDKLREELILKELGTSIDRLDSFLELVASSIEYAESAVQQLQPARHTRLNVKQLQSIHDQTATLRELQAWKASGHKP